MLGIIVCANNTIFLIVMGSGTLKNGIPPYIPPQKTTVLLKATRKTLQMIEFH